MTIEKTPRVVLALQGAQMPANAIRGIGRWSHQLTRALVANHRDLVAAVSLDPQLPLPRVIHELPNDLPIIFTNQRPTVRSDERLIFHQMSVLEDLDLRRIWPTWAREPEVGLAVTVYDMIPPLFPDEYFTGPLRYLLQSRLNLISNANLIVSISDATALDTSRVLGIRKESICTVHTEADARFSPHPRGRRAAFALLPANLGIEPDFILSVGNVDPRKNIPALLRAFACLPRHLRDTYQLVLTASQASDPQLRELESFADGVGIRSRVTVLPFIDDSLMVRLYQACYGMVYPSSYEGLGLPVLEAMRCGAAVIASDIPPICELIHDPEGRFDPSDIHSFGRKLERLLTDSAFAERRRVQGMSDAGRFSWKASCDNLVRAYHRVAASRP